MGKIIKIKFEERPDIKPTFFPENKHDELLCNVLNDNFLRNCVNLHCGDDYNNISFKAIGIGNVLLDVIKNRDMLRVNHRDNNDICKKYNDLIKFLIDCFVKELLKTNK